MDTDGSYDTLDKNKGSSFGILWLKVIKSTEEEDEQIKTSVSVRRQTKELTEFQ